MTPGVRRSRTDAQALAWQHPRASPAPVAQGPPGCASLDDRLPPGRRLRCRCQWAANGCRNSLQRHGTTRKHERRMNLDLLFGAGSQQRPRLRRLLWTIFYFDGNATCECSCLMSVTRRVSGRVESIAQAIQPKCGDFQMPAADCLHRRVAADVLRASRSGAGDQLPCAFRRTGECVSPGSASSRGHREPHPINRKAARCRGRVRSGRSAYGPPTRHDRRRYRRGERLSHGTPLSLAGLGRSGNRPRRHA